jgi:hypothetical protein
VASFTEPNILSSFKAVGVSPFNPNVILDKFVDSDSDATIYKGEQWRFLDRVARRALRDATEKEASIIRQSLHHMAIQNTLLRSENEGLMDALTTKRNREKQGKPLALLQHYEYWGPYMMWTPRSFQEARTRMRLAKREAEEEEELQKEVARKSKAAATANRKQIAEEKRQKAAREKEERERKRAEERQAIDARKAERARKKQQRDSQNRSQTAQKRKRKASQQQGVKKRQKRGSAAVQSGSVAYEPPSAPAPTVNSRGRRILQPRKYW